MFANSLRLRGVLMTSGALLLNSSRQVSSDGSTLTKPIDSSITLYQYQSCPFCSKTRAFLDYYGIQYKKVEVNPLFKREMKFSSYRKVPFIIVDDSESGTIQVSYHDDNNGHDCR